MGDVLVHVAITESQTNLQRKMIYLSLLSFQKILATEREDSMHTFEYEKFSSQVSGAFMVIVTLPIQAESLWLNRL